jgi:KDO2-lipid IV(A) lauroyltransferase
MKKALYYLTYTFVYLLSLLPLWVLYLLSDVIFALLYHVVKYRRPLVRKHLKESFPEKTDDELHTIERRFYQWFGDYLVESIKLLTISRRQLRRRMVFKGTDIVDTIVREGQSCAVYLGHYCNWEWITSLPLWVTPEAQCGQIYHVLENSDYDRLFLHLRQRMGAVCIPMAETLRRIIKYKQEGRQVVIGYISDQVPFWNNIHHWLDFLHHDTPVLTGTERLAKQTGHAVLYLDVQCKKRGYYEAEFKLITRDPKTMADYAITDAYFHLLEASIQRAPEYYLWTHNRWKRTHDEFNLRYDAETGRVNLEPLENILKEKGLV